MRSIALLMAMQSEAQPVIEALSLMPQNHPFHTDIPFKLYQGPSENDRIDLLVSGTDPHHKVDNVATVPAALMAYLAITHLSPAIIVNAGTAGGIAAKGSKIGDVYLSSGHFCFHDRRIPIPGFQDYGRGRYPAFKTDEIASSLGLKTGAISTGNSLDMLAEDFQEIKNSGAIIKDMEAAAIAWVCQTLDVPLIAMKAITDLIDDPAPTEEQFLKNLAIATTRLGKAVPLLVQRLAGSS